MEPKKVTINYALLCKELEKQGKTKEKFSAELGRSKSFVYNMAKNPEQTEDFERTMCLLLGLEPGSLVKQPEKKGMTAAQALTVCRIQTGQYGSIYVRQYKAEEEEKGERKMTNNDHLNNITGEMDTPEISAVKMILTRIDEDLENDLYEENRDKYLNLYKSQKEWLEREVENA